MSAAPPRATRVIQRQRTPGRDGGDGEGRDGEVDQEREGRETGGLKTGDGERHGQMAPFGSNVTAHSLREERNHDRIEPETERRRGADGIPMGEPQPTD